MNKKQAMQCSFTDETSLYRAYMPFVTGGGLFIRTHRFYPLGTLVELSVQLMTEIELYKVEAKVVWITPQGAQGNKMPGVGVQFISENSCFLCHNIETYLAGMLESPQLTDTL